MYAIRLFAAALITTAVSASTAAAQPATATGSAVDVSHLPGEAATGLIVRVRDTLQSPDNSLWPIEIFSALGKKELGIDPLDVEQVLIFWEKTAKPGPEGLGVIVRLAKPYKVDDILPEFGKRSVKASIGDQPIRQLGPGEASYAIVKDRTLLVAFEPMLKKMLTAKGDGAVGKLLKGTSPRATAAYVVSVDALRDEVDGALSQAPKLPPPFADLLEIPKLTSAVVANVRIDKKFAAQVTLHGRDGAAAEKLETTLKNVLKTGREMVVERVSATVDANDPLGAAQVQYVKRLSQAIVDGIGIARTSDRVTLSVQTDVGTAQLAVLPALMLPALNRVKESARQNQDASNVKQILLAMKTYAIVNKDRFPPQANRDAGGKPLLSWRVHILPYLEDDVGGGTQLYKKFRLDEPWDSEHNRKLIDQMPEVYRSAADGGDRSTTRIVVPAGKGTLFSDGVGVKEGAIKDGTSKTAILVQLPPGKGVIWTKPDDLDVDSDKFMDVLLSADSPGVLTGFGDGAVRMLRKPLDAEFLKALFSIAGGEDVRPDRD